MSELNCKIVIVGESGVGKTCIISSFLGNEFSEEHLTTIGVGNESKVINIDNEEVRVEFWDTAGQEIFRALTKMYYNGAHIAIFVYDITNEKSFEELKKYWVNVVKENANELKGK
jgi:small GTP-binding protein